MENTKPSQIQISSRVVRMVEIRMLKPYAQNPRVHSIKQIEKIKKSIQQFGFTAPILVDNELNIVAGHARYEAMKQLNAVQIPTIQLENLTPEQIKAYRLADNRIAEDSEWDKNLLKIEFKELLDLNFEVIDTGFEIPEIDSLTFELISDENKENEDSEVCSLLDSIPHRVQKGDVWALGEHKLICSDALNQESFDSLLQGEKAEIVITDPPYNVKIKGHVCGNGKITHKDFTMASGEMTDKEFFEFSKTFMTRLIENSTDGSLHYIFIDWRGIKTFLNAGEQYKALKNICVWDKTTGGMGSLYRSQHEFVCVFKNGQSPHINNIQLGSKGRYRTNVWSVKGMNVQNKQAKELFKLHPTVKPVGLLSDILLDASSPGGIVLDTFGGSGSTLIACEKTKRKARIIEIDERYCDAIIYRWEKFTGEKANLVVKGGDNNEER